MEQNNFFKENNTLIGKLVVGIGILLGIFLLVLIFGKIKAYGFIGSGLDATNTISVTGQGKVEKTPDTARIVFSVQNESKEVATAQAIVSKKVDLVTKALIALGIEEKYIKTDSYNSYPQYDYPVTPPCYSGVCPRSSSTPILRGYQVTHSITVSVKDLTLTDKVLGVLGQNAVTDISGPNFGFEDDKAATREARDVAIADAKAEAKKLADALGVTLVRIVSFSENGGGGAYPVAMYEKMDISAASSAAPALPIGAQKVNSTVTLVYEIR